MGLLTGFLTKKKGLLSQEWAVSLDSPITSQLAAGFLDEESIVVGTASGQIYAIDSLGKTKWAYFDGKNVSQEEAFFMENEKGAKIRSAPYIADINNDGKGEVLIGSEDGRLMAISHKGRLLWEFKAKSSIFGSAFVSDIDDDKEQEIMFGSGDGNFYALTGKGKPIWSFNVRSPVESQPNVLNSVQRLIVFGTNEGVTALDAKGRKLWDFKTDGKVTAQPSFANLYNDERSFVIVGSQDNNLYSISSDGKLNWIYKTEGKIFSRAIIADLNKDRHSEIVMGSCDDKLHIISSNGSKLWEYETNFWIVAPPIVFDFDDDKELEIAVGSYDNNVYILEAEGEYMVEYIPGISGIITQPGHYSHLGTSEPGSYIGKVLSQYKTDGIVISQALLQQSRSIVTASDIGKIYKLKYKKS